MAWVEQCGAWSWRVRYRRDGKPIESVSGFDSVKAAQDYAHLIDADRRRGVWLDPSGLRTTLGCWVERWLPTIDVDTRTMEGYRSKLRNHILPRFGAVPLGEITALDIRSWTTEALRDDYAQTSVSGWLNLLSMILCDAVDQRLIPFNPVHRRRRRGRRSRKLRPEKVWATPTQVRQVADQAGALGGPTARLLIITAAWTGCRWGELTGLHRRNVDLHHGLIIIDPHHGALHEGARKRWIGPPKTASSARRIPLPRFLLDLLRTHLETHPYEYVFTTRSGTWLWRSTFDRRILRPAADGNLAAVNPKARTYPVCPGLTFHGLRHSHNTWMIDDDTPEVARSRRLGHHLDNRLVETYSHVSGGMQQRLLAHLEHRWDTATGKPSSRPSSVRQPSAPDHVESLASHTDQTSTAPASTAPPRTSDRTRASSDDIRVGARTNRKKSPRRSPREKHAFQSRSELYAEFEKQLGLGSEQKPNLDTMSPEGENKRGEPIFSVDRRPVHSVSLPHFSDRPKLRTQEVANR